ncbi:MAG: S-methyl-5-thioribose-1-phosphate isomerase [Candidatus Bathyarchaeota archaeon]|nr:MAG: S-methyl-5-thioribose-1-phosphate isomerase [Candidatus Bathyarchaeota archaeon]
MRTIEWRDGTLATLDQTKLPNENLILEMRECEEVAFAIKEMKMRGAPLIGVAAAYGLALTAYHSKAKTREDLIRQIEASAKILIETRPTAVNLFWAVERILRKARGTTGDAETVTRVVVNEAQRMADEDVEANLKIGEHGAELINDKDVILTHCNAGSLATVDHGTALGIVRTAWAQGKKIAVIATETRPKLQGARLTAYELKRDGIPVSLITDNMVGYVMSRRLINEVVVGADRIVRDAVINKIGTYSLAVLAHEHNIPFYVAAPKSTFDLVHTSKDAIIEKRNADEVTYIGSQRIAPMGVKVLNPAFDITPIKYVSGIICETGVLSKTKLEKLATASKHG